MYNAYENKDTLNRESSTKDSGVKLARAVDKGGPPLNWIKHVLTHHLAFQSFGSLLIHGGAL